MNPSEADEVPFRDKWVSIDPEWGADGVWEKNGVCGDAENLPVPADLQARIVAWGRWYRECDEEDRPGEFDYESFAAEGLEIARAVKRALPDWTVIYRDLWMSIQERAKLPHMRSDCRYEVV